MEGYVYSILHNIHPQPLARISEPIEEPVSKTESTEEFDEGPISREMEQSLDLEVPEAPETSYESQSFEPQPTFQPRIEVPAYQAPTGMTASILRPEELSGDVMTPTPQLRLSPIVPKPSRQFTASMKPHEADVSINQEQAAYIDPMSKLAVFISDPRVESIECQGPGKNILVRKDGLVQRTKASLSKEETTKVLEYYSEKTRIPVVGGTFRVAYNNLIITAVVSEAVGTRFVIHKRRLVN